MESITKLDLSTLPEKTAIKYAQKVIALDSKSYDQHEVVLATSQHLLQ